jgi:hypothetical protein
VFLAKATKPSLTDPSPRRLGPRARRYLDRHEPEVLETKS